MKPQLSGAAPLLNEDFLISAQRWRRRRRRVAPGPGTMLMDDVLMLLNVIFTEQGKL